jgi:hypothetical protein
MPKLTGSFFVDGFAKDVVIRDSFAYALDQPTGLSVFDLTKPGVFEPVALAPLANPIGLFAQLAVSPGGEKAERVGIVTGGGPLQIFTLRPGLDPVLATTYRTPGTAQRVAIHGTRAYVADGRAGLQVLDLSAPSQPVVVGNYETPMPARDIAGHGVARPGRHGRRSAHPATAAVRHGGSLHGSVVAERKGRMPQMAKPWLMTTTIGLLAACVTLAAQSSGSSGGGALRAAYLKANPAHAVADPAGGELRGVAVDLARELARRRGVAAALMGLDSPQAVLDAVRDGKADIGFVAYNPERAGAVEFTQPYLLVQQTFIVAATSTIRAVADLDRTGRKIGATQGDSIALYLRRNLKQAQLVEQPALTPAQVLRAARRWHRGCLRRQSSAADRLPERRRGRAAAARRSVWRRTDHHRAGGPPRGARWIERVHRRRPPLGIHRCLHPAKRCHRHRGRPTCQIAGNRWLATRQPATGRPPGRPSAGNPSANPRSKVFPK